MKARLGYRDRLKRTYKRLLKSMKKDLREAKKKKSSYASNDVNNIKSSIKEIEIELRWLDRADFARDVYQGTEIALEAVR